MTINLYIKKHKEIEGMLTKEEKAKNLISFYKSSSQYEKEHPEKKVTGITSKGRRKAVLIEKKQVHGAEHIIGAVTVEEAKKQDEEKKKAAYSEIRQKQISNPDVKRTPGQFLKQEYERERFVRESARNWRPSYGTKAEPSKEVKVFRNDKGQIVGVEDAYKGESRAAPEGQRFDERDVRDYRRDITLARAAEARTVQQEDKNYFGAESITKAERSKGVTGWLERSLFRQKVAHQEVMRSAPGGSSPNILKFAWGIDREVTKGIRGAGLGVLSAAAHPIKTIKGFGRMFVNPAGYVGDVAKETITEFPSRPLGFVGELGVNAALGEAGIRAYRGAKASIFKPVKASAFTQGYTLTTSETPIGGGFGSYVMSGSDDLRVNIEYLNRFGTAVKTEKFTGSARFAMETAGDDTAFQIGAIKYQKLEPTSTQVIRGMETRNPSKGLIALDEYGEPIGGGRPGEPFATEMTRSGEIVGVSKAWTAEGEPQNIMAYSDYKFGDITQISTKSDFLRSSDVTDVKSVLKTETRAQRLETETGPLTVVRSQGKIEGTSTEIASVGVLKDTASPIKILDTKITVSEYAGRGVVAPKISEEYLKARLVGGPGETSRTSPTVLSSGGWQFKGSGEVRTDFLLGSKIEIPTLYKPAIEPGKTAPGVEPSSVRPVTASQKNIERTASGIDTANLQLSNERLNEIARNAAITETTGKVKAVIGGFGVAGTVRGSSGSAGSTWRPTLQSVPTPTARYISGFEPVMRPEVRPQSPAQDALRPRGDTIVITRGKYEGGRKGRSEPITEPVIGPEIRPGLKPVILPKTAQGITTRQIVSPISRSEPAYKARLMTVPGIGGGPGLPPPPPPPPAIPTFSGVTVEDELEDIVPNRKRKGGSMFYGYSPSMVAGVFDIRGARPKPVTGWEIRPIPTERWNPPKFTREWYKTHGRGF